MAAFVLRKTGGGSTLRGGDTLRGAATGDAIATPATVAAFASGREDPADPENPGAFTSAAAGAWCAATMALKEAPAVTTTFISVIVAGL